MRHLLTTVALIVGAIQMMPSTDIEPPKGKQDFIHLISCEPGSICDLKNRGTDIRREYIQLAQLTDTGGGDVISPVPAEVDANGFVEGGDLLASPANPGPMNAGVVSNGINYSAGFEGQQPTAMSAPYAAGTTTTMVPQTRRQCQDVTVNVPMSTPAYKQDVYGTRQVPYSVSVTKTRPVQKTITVNEQYTEQEQRFRTEPVKIGERTVAAPMSAPVSAPQCNTCQPAMSAPIMQAPTIQTCQPMSAPIMQAAPVVRQPRRQVIVVRNPPQVTPTCQPMAAPVAAPTCTPAYSVGRPVRSGRRRGLLRRLFCRLVCS